MTMSAERPEGWEMADAMRLHGVRLARTGRVDEARICWDEAYTALRRMRGEPAIYTRWARQVAR